MLWLFKPNTISERLMFRTDVRSTRSGEVRESLKDGSQVFTLGFNNRDGQASLIQQAILENITGEWSMPLWSNITRSAIGINSGATSIVAETDSDYRVGGQLVIISPDGSYEILEVNAVNPGVIDVTEPVVGDYPEKSIIAPMGEFIIPFGLNQDLTLTRTVMNIEFYRTDPEDLSQDNYPDFEGFDILTDSTVVIGSLSGGLRQKLDFIQNGFGVYALEEIENYVRWRATIGYIDSTYSDRWSRVQFMHRMRGKDRPFWLPTWKNDLKVVASSPAGVSTISVDLITETPSTLVGRKLQIIISGDVIYRTIQSAFISGDSIVLSLDQNHGITITDSAKVSFMRLVRFDTDVFEIRHQIVPHGFVSSFTAPVIEVIT